MATTENRPPNGNGANAPNAPTPAQAGPGAPVGTPAAVAGKRKKNAKRAYLILGGLAAAVVATYYIHDYMTRNLVSTDDAQIDADVVPVSARVGGVIKTMNAHDNSQVVKDPKGALPTLVQIDRVDYDAKVAAASADRDAAQAALDTAQLQVQIAKATVKGGTTQAQAQVAGSAAAAQAAGAQVAAAQAQIARAKTDLAKAESDLARAQKLHDQGAITGRELEAALAARDSAKAILDGANATLAAARGMQSNASAQVAVAQGKLQQTTPEQDQIQQAEIAVKLATARLESAKAQLAIAQMQADYTAIAAPAEGYVSRLAAHEGQLVQPGQTLMMLVPSDTYVVANFKETQIGRIKPGQTVDISVDAISGKTFTGVVDSIAPGTGARFSLLPPDNATGNFVKVVQRVPVKIRWKEPPGAELRAGLSAEVTIHLE
ncbi:MAG TPA: HlyD family secretion protein [Kofleriaceae bacterium]|nr:HlyD family secretion protein [Kofleriaceae bacterium]